jgi:hypothetical protein
MSVAQEALEDESPLNLIFGLMVAVAASVVFGLADFQILTENVEPYADWMFVGGLLSAYILSDRDFGKLQNYEGFAFILPIAVLAGITFVPSIENFVMGNRTIQLVLLAVTMGGFYVLATNLTLTDIAIEWVLGLILIFTASSAFGLTETSVFGYELASNATWVFFLSLTGAYLVSERAIGELSRLELVALGVSISAYVAVTQLPNFASTITNNLVFGGALFVITLLAFYTLIRDGDIPKADEINSVIS